jgi:uncharacterized membrane protein YesL
VTSGHWAARTYAACSTVAWCCALNALWLAFTVMGGVVLGIGPATVTACILTRRRMRGEPVGAREFAATWRREFLRGSAVMLPVAALAVLLLSNAAFFAALGPDAGAGAARLATLAALVVVVTAAAYLGPMYAHYELPLRSYALKALRFALARPAPTVLLLLVFAALAFASAAAPVLLLTVSVGAWLHTSTWLCVRFFQENEARLAEAARQSGQPAPDPPDRLVRGLPSQPARIR